MDEKFYYEKVPVPKRAAVLLDGEGRPVASADGYNDFAFKAERSALGPFRVLVNVHKGIWIEAEEKFYADIPRGSTYHVHVDN